MSSHQPSEGTLPRPSLQPQSASSQDSENTIAESNSYEEIPDQGDMENSEASVRALGSNPISSTFPSKPQQVDIRRCWICQMDETEDTPDSSAWRCPCPCSLVAHDECLLEWVAAGEAPKDGGTASTQKFYCPVCKAEIKIERPRDALVEIFDQAQIVARSLAYPTAISTLLGCGYAGLFAYGVNTLYLVFGREEAVKILVTMRRPEGSYLLGGEGKLRDTLVAIIASTDPFFPRFESIGWREFIALPMIAPALVLSRSSLGGFVFPLMISAVGILYQNIMYHRRPNSLVLKYFISSPTHRDIYNWPPTPGLAFASLPQFLTLYNNFYQYTFGDLERKWDQAVQRKPRDGETVEQIAEQQADQEDDNIFGIEIVEEEVHMDAGGHIIPVADAVPQADAIADRQEGGVPARNHEDIFFQRNWSVARIIMNVTGALSFPLISSAMGTLLEVLLPARLVGHGPFGNKFRSQGILQEKWGRTIVGGCLFVVLKDAFTLYCKWKKAQNFGKRKILDYRGPSGRASS